MAKIGVLGTGYVGLVTAVCFAKLGHDVLGCDLDSNKISVIRSGKSPIFERGLEDLLNEVLVDKKLSLTSSYEDLVDCQFVFLCLPTPQDQDGSADLSFVLHATSELKNKLAKNSFLVTKSTVPVGSWAEIKKTLDREDVKIVSNPEFLREGTAVFDFFNPDRIIIGCENREARQKVADLYKNPQAETVLTDNTTAELIKYASNSFLAMKLSFVNDIAALSDRVGANTLEVLQGMGKDKRIGENFITPGPGWGGSCFPKDVRALMMISEKVGMNLPILTAAWDSNERAHRRFVELAKNYLNGSLVGKQIAVWGLAFKAFTDDTRESPALAIIDRLIGQGAEVVAYDPEASVPRTTNRFKIVSKLQETIEGSQLIMVLTEWPEFSEFNPNLLVPRGDLAGVIDARGVLSRKVWEEAGFNFWGVAG